MFFYFFSFLILSFLRINHSYVYSPCIYATSCSSKCCKYQNALSTSDRRCTDFHKCNCAISSYHCGYETKIISAGYHECSSDVCPFGCCLYSSYLSYNDFYCSDLSCHCRESSYCQSSSIVTTVGFHSCSSSSCSSSCCYYSKALIISDYYCSSTSCTCSSHSSLCSSSSLSNILTTVGYHNCFPSYCSSGCCYYSEALTNYDFSCISTSCTCSSYSSYCPSLMILTTKGFHYCSTSYCDSGCCYYSKSLNISQDSCSSSYCFCATEETPCYSSSSYLENKELATYLTKVSGKKYVDVNYASWKAIKAVGSFLYLIMFFVNGGLLYRRWKKHKKLISPENMEMERNNREGFNPSEVEDIPQNQQSS